jgi:uncharacterized phage protein gp47/JayE
MKKRQWQKDLEEKQEQLKRHCTSRWIIRHRATIQDRLASRASASVMARWTTNNTYIPYTGDCYNVHAETP